MTTINKSILNKNNFRLLIDKIPTVEYYVKTVNIPGLQFSEVAQPAGIGLDAFFPGDKVAFDTLDVTFLVDEDLENYLEIQHWLRGLGFPDSLKEIYDWQSSNPNTPRGELNYTCDGTLNVLSSSNTPNFKVKFLDMFPVSLSDLDFDATDSDIDYLTANVTFKYTIYNITDLDDNLL